MTRDWRENPNRDSLLDRDMSSGALAPAARGGPSCGDQDNAVGATMSGKSTGSVDAARRRAGPVGAMVALVAVLVPGARADAPGQFDPPVAIRDVPARTGSAAHDAARCSVFQDLTVREIGIDTPAPDPAAILPGPPRPDCALGHVQGQVTLETQGFGLNGRKGPFLLFAATDPNGAAAFKVLDAKTGRVLYSDAIAADGAFRVVAVEGGGLHLVFPRALNAPCSLAQDGARCWATLVGQGLIPRAMAGAVPPASACAASYRAAKAGPDDPSIVIYDVDMTLDTAGHARVDSRGTVRCAPVP